MRYIDMLFQKKKKKKSFANIPELQNSLSLWFQANLVLVWYTNYGMHQLL